MISQTLKKMRGFTLIELMIVVAIVAIMAAVAYPSYQNSIRKSRVVEAKTAMENVVAEQERYYYRNNAYTRDLTQHGYPTPPAAGPAQRDTENGFYKIQVVQDGDGNCATTSPWNCTKYFVRVRPISSQSAHPWLYRLYSDGRKYRCEKANTTNFACTGGTEKWDWAEN